MIRFHVVNNKPPTRGSKGKGVKVQDIEDEDIGNIKGVLDARGGEVRLYVRAKGEFAEQAILLPNLPDDLGHSIAGVNHIEWEYAIGEDNFGFNILFIRRKDSKA
jgi:hypothetical protein